MILSGLRGVGNTTGTARYVADDLDEIGDRSCAQALLTRALHNGTGAAQQRRIGLRRTLERRRLGPLVMSPASTVSTGRARHLRRWLASHNG